MSRHFFCLMTLNSLQMNIHVSRAFDSCDFDLCLHVMQHLGLPDRILGLLRNQWQEHFLREVFTLHLYKEPKDCRRGTPGLPLQCP